MKQVVKYSLATFVVLYSTFLVVACGSNNNNNNDIQTGQAVNLGCPAGTTFVNGSCVNGSNQSVASGISFQSTNYNQNTLSISNSSVFTRFLKEAMSLCDQGYYDAGTASCTSYTNAYVMATLQAVSADANAARLTIQVYPRYGYFNGWFSVNFGTFGVQRNPIALDMVVSLVNNSQGIEARSYGGAGTISANKLFQFIVPNGKLQDGYMDYQLAYNGTSGGVFMTGRMNRCANASCGLTLF